ncbi:hypothetical protein RFI_27647 [Reticulomyxa filosa]|uniref:Uncharacterized protein n=1 Tax=Reticulomyxa filosa TaxID=46433 RepID=X6M9N9_RETFI|nr:hypothetical protein RFI_27647 [Reticulomyxa filosa]|eukprot:ETO09730.1 hypothetical protein RFI_27647 [Reticulomyxa filosa]
MTTFNNEKEISTQQALVNLIYTFTKLLFIISCVRFVIELSQKKKRIKSLFSIGFEYYILNLDGFMNLTNLLSIMLRFCFLNIYFIDYTTFDDNQFICSGSSDETIRVWNINNNKKGQLLKGHFFAVYCVKFSPYHFHNNNRNVICSSSQDRTICFWDVKSKKQLKILYEHKDPINDIEFSPFSGGRYLCSASSDKTIRLWDVETYKSLHVFNGHTGDIICVDISSLQSNSNNKMNNIGVISGNGYTICSGSCDQTIRIWDIETTEQLNVLKGHTHHVVDVKYGSNELGNTILSGSRDESVRLWDIRSGEQILTFNGHTNLIITVEYSPLVVNNSEICNSSNVICSGSLDNTIRFWDVRSNKNELHIIKGDEEEDGISSFKFFSLQKNKKSGFNLCYGSVNGPIRIWG